MYAFLKTLQGIWNEIDALFFQWNLNLTKDCYLFWLYILMSHFGLIEEMMCHIILNNIAIESFFRQCSFLGGHLQITQFDSTKQSSVFRGQKKGWGLGKGGFISKGIFNWKNVQNHCPSIVQSRVKQFCLFVFRMWPNSK